MIQALRYYRHQKTKSRYVAKYIRTDGSKCHNVIQMVSNCACFVTYISRTLYYVATIDGIGPRTHTHMYTICSMCVYVCVHACCIYPIADAECGHARISEAQWFWTGTYKHTHTHTQRYTKTHNMRAHTHNTWCYSAMTSDSIVEGIHIQRVEEQ